MNLVGALTVIYLRYKTLCKRDRIVNETIVSYHRPSQSNATHDSTFNGLNEITSQSGSILPRFVSNMSTIPGHSKALSMYEKNVRAKDSVIILPFGFSTSTPKR